MRKQWNRILALLLSLFMVASMIPAAAAEELLLEPGDESTVSDTPRDETPPAAPAEEGEGEEEPQPPEEGEEEEEPQPPEEGEEEEEEEEEEEPPAEDSDLPAQEGEPEAGAFPPASMDSSFTTFASDGASYEYVLDTDGIDSGAVYAIYTNESVNSDNRILYHTGTGMTNKVGGTVSDNSLILNGSFAASRQLWTVTAVDGGYTLQSMDSGRYLDLGTASGNNINTSADPVTLTVTPLEDGTFTISQEGGCCFSYNAASNGNIYAGTEAAPLRFYKQTDPNTEPEPDPEPVDPLAIPGYTRVTSADLDPEKYHLIVTQDSDGNLYALYADEGGKTLSSGDGVLGINGIVVAVLTVEDGSVSATHLRDSASLEMDALRFVTAQSNGKFTFQSENGSYLVIDDTSLFSDNSAELTVTVADGVFTIKNTATRNSPRVLGFNRVGDSLSGQFSDGSKYVTNFWGPRSTSFPIYLYTLDGVTVEPEEPEAPEKPEPPDQARVYEYLRASGEFEPGVYAIVGTTVENNTSRPRVMHCAESDTVTNQCQVAAGDYTNGVLSDRLTLNCGLSHLWEIKENGGGYTIQSLTGKYLGQRSGYDQLPVTNTPAVFSIAPLENGGYAITWAAGDRTLNLSWDNKWGGSTEGYTIYLYKQVEVEPEMAQTHLSGVSYGQPLVKVDTGSGYFRIPALLTLDNGWILASSDIRWQTAADNPQNLDTIVSISKDGGKTWEWEVVNYYADEATTTTSQASAAFIDPSFIQSGDGTVWMAVDATPSYVGLMWGNRRGYASRGFDSQGRMLVALGQADADAPTDTAPYTYYVDLNAEGAVYEVGGETVTLHPICASADDAETGYWVDAFLDLYYDYGEEDGMKPVLCAQRGSDKVVQNNLFYRQSQWKVYPAFFIMVRSAQVTADGLEWSEPRYLDIKLSETESFLGVCPGRGIIAQVDGHERIIFPLYDNQTGNELASVVYSDDGGQTWHRGSRANNLNGTGKSSESQIVVLPNGDLRMYSRNTVNYLGYADSSDGGVTWGPYTKDMDLYSQNPGNGCMMSFINVDGYLVSPDNTVYENLIMASYPRVQRSVGTVRIGSIDPETNLVTWLNTDTALNYDSSNNSSNFSYSCLTQLDGVEGADFGFLYENHAGAGEITYANLTIGQVMGEEGWTLLQEMPQLPEISLDTDLLDLDVGADATLTAVTFPAGAAIVWDSSDESVATVENGVVTAVASGRAVITASVTVFPLTRTASAEVVVQDGETIVLPGKYLSGLKPEDFPVVTTYELAADGLESGAVYAIFDAGSGKRLLYHASGSSSTDQWGASASDGLLNLSGAKTTAVLWTVTQNEDGTYTLCSLDDGKYLNYGTSGTHNHVPVTATQHAFTITPLEDGSYTLSWEANGATVYLDWNGKWGAGSDPYPLQFFLKVDSEPYSTYTVSADGLRDLIAAAEAAEADYADVLALVGTYSDKDEALAAQARIDDASRALYAALRDPGADPDPDPDTPETPVPPAASATPSTAYYTLTIRYVDEDGNEVAPVYSVGLPSGRAYSVTSPEVEGYVPDQAVVSGTIRGATTVTVVYTAVEVEEPLVPAEPVAPVDPDPNLPDGGDEDITTPDVPLNPTPNLPDNEDIIEPEVPLAPTPGLPGDSSEDIADEDVPLTNVPKTGDSTAAWLFGMIASGIGLAWLAFSGRRKEDEEA